MKNFMEKHLNKINIGLIVYGLMKHILWELQSNLGEIY